jgi:hypothetical protein
MRGRMGGMRFRKLRIVWSMVCGILCLLLIVLWVRSYRALGERWQSTTIRARFLYVSSSHGQICWSGKPDLLTSLTGTPFKHVSNNIGGILEIGPPAVWGFKYGRTNSSAMLRTPYRFPALLVASLCTTPWLPFKRFSLRTLLIATTLVAVALGLMVAVLRWPAS